MAGPLDESTIDLDRVEGLGYCHMPAVTPRELPAGTDPGRAAAILLFEHAWVNGTRLRYHLFEGRWHGDDEDRQVVRDAFGHWEDVGIGLRFTEVDDPGEAELRIGFDRAEGSWSYLGRQALTIPSRDRTMSFGWRLAGWDYGFDTALHEIGHAMALPHEHQNPHAGIEWDEDAVHATFSQPPNSWDRATIHHNILRKLPESDLRGSDWDPHSIMHYGFPAGLIRRPEEYLTSALRPDPGLSDLDRAWIRRFYPPQEPQLPQLEPFVSAPLELAPGEQVDHVIRPDRTGHHTIETFGRADTVLVLFEDVEGEGPRFVAGDDDSGSERNARVRARLHKGRTYRVRLRLYWSWASGRTALLLHH
jgi:hypothetical protein